MTIGVPSGELGDSPAPLVVRTVSLDAADLGALVDLLPADHPVAWVRRGEGLVGWGMAARVTTAGATRFADADKWWRETTARAVVRDEVEEPGTGLVCFGSVRLRRRARRLRAGRAGVRRAAAAATAPG